MLIRYLLVKQLFFLCLLTAVWPSFIYSLYKYDKNRVEATINTIIACDEKGRDLHELHSLVSKINKKYENYTPIFSCCYEKKARLSMKNDLQEVKSIAGPHKSGNSHLTLIEEELSVVASSKPIVLKPSVDSFPNEIWELILVQTISEPITTKEEFQSSLRILASLTATSKTFNDLLSGDFFKKSIVPRMFNDLLPEAFNQLITVDIIQSLSRVSTSNTTVLKSIMDVFSSYTSRSKRASKYNLADISVSRSPISNTIVLKDIKEVLLNIYTLRTTRTKYLYLTLEKKLTIERALLSLVQKGLSPNLFVKKRNNLLHIAILADLPELVTFLIKKGADVNMKNRSKSDKEILYNENYSERLNEERKKNRQTDVKSKYDQIPFVLALQCSLKSALILLNNENIDIDAIAVKLNEARCFLNNDEGIEIIKKLVEKGIEPDTEVGIYSNYFFRTSLFGFVASNIWKAYFRGQTESREEKSMDKARAVFKFLLTNGAMRDEFYTFPSSRRASIRRNIGLLPGFKEIFEEHDRNQENLN